MRQHRRHLSRVMNSDGTIPACGCQKVRWNLFSKGEGGNAVCGRRRQRLCFGRRLLRHGRVVLSASFGQRKETRTCGLTYELHALSAVCFLLPFIFAHATVAVIAVAVVVGLLLVALFAATLERHHPREGSVHDNYIVDASESFLKRDFARQERTKASSSRRQCLPPNAQRQIRQYCTHAAWT